MRYSPLFAGLGLAALLSVACSSGGGSSGSMEYDKNAQVGDFTPPDGVLDSTADELSTVPDVTTADESDGSRELPFVLDLPPVETAELDSLSPDILLPCHEDADCGEAQECINGKCVPFIPCHSSKDCPEGVCWLEMGKCVDCLGPEDCSEDMVCYQTRCVPLCDSDKDCKAEGKVCDKELSICVECITHADCPATSFCLDKVCTPDVCEAGTQSCDGNIPSQCSEVGDALIHLEPCGETQTCKVEEGVALCIDQVCQPGSQYCDEYGHAVLCSEDGLSFLSDEDCGAQGEVCLEGVCVPQVCIPDERVCTEDLLSLLVCDETGAFWTLQECPEGTYCKEGAGLVPSMCVPQICTPGEKVCLGSYAGVCNESGSGLHGGGINCAEQDLLCVAGECKKCSPSPETCDGQDNDCDGLIDNEPTDCQPPSLCANSTCYSPPQDIPKCQIKQYLNSVYMACSTNKSWLVAKELCANWYGSHLVVLQDAAEEQFLLKTISGPAYIGYTDQDDEGEWQWIEGSSSYENWCTMQPDNWQNSEDCCVMNSTFAQDEQCWIDVSCTTTTATGFICEVDWL